MQDTGFGVLTGNDAETKFFKAGTIIFHEGDAAQEMFVIKGGKVRIQLGNRRLSEVSAGRRLWRDGPDRQPTAQRHCDRDHRCRTRAGDRAAKFLFMVSQTPYFALRVMRVLAERLRATNKTFG